MGKKLMLMACTLIVAMLCGCTNISVFKEAITYGAVESGGAYFKITPKQFEDMFNENLSDKANRIGDSKKVDGGDWVKYEYELNDNGKLSLFDENKNGYISSVEFALYDDTEFKESYANLSVKMFDESYSFDTILDWLFEQEDSDTDGNFNALVTKPFGKHEIVFGLNVFADPIEGEAKEIFGFTAIAKKYTLTAGTYEVGTDLEVGTYNIYIDSGSGICSINDNNGDIFEEEFGEDGIYGYQNAKLEEGDIIKISGNAALEFNPNY